jgi:hypothetical protein
MLLIRHRTIDVSHRDEWTTHGSPEACRSEAAMAWKESFQISCHLFDTILVRLTPESYVTLPELYAE